MSVNRYPKLVSVQRQDGDTEVELRLMTQDDEAAIADFANRLPLHDLLFLSRDIRVPKVLSAWAQQLQDGEMISLIAMNGSEVAGCSAIVADAQSWSAHVGELRVLLAPEYRSQGLGRILIQESFLLAVASGLEKLTAQMTSDQDAAINVFQDIGFRPEALLRDQVRDVEGKFHDIVVLGHSVAAFQARAAQYGLDEAFGGE